jgi:protein involved in polysaccharide export with SLBB domain
MSTTRETPKMKKLTFIFAAVTLLICIPSLNAEAQISQSSMLSATSTERSASNYYFAKPNELTIIVNVVGYVQRPGRYEISNSIDLINLMALAGGATPDGALNDVKITRMSTVDERIRMRELHMNLEEVATLLPAELRLYPGDIIQVGKSGWASFRDSFSVVVSAAIIVTAVSQVIIANKIYR